jgi:hypothetical protein
MKNIILNIMAIAVPAVLLTFNPAGAGERVRVFEMGEGGFTIEFPMTSEEIAAADAAYNKVIAASRKSVANLSNHVKVFEMGEGGQTVEFRMTAAEITAANAENARLAAIKSARTGPGRPAGVKYELAESGHVIEFPEARTEMEPGDLVIARDTTYNAGTRIQ